MKMTRGEIQELEILSEKRILDQDDLVFHIVDFVKEMCTRKDLTETEFVYKIVGDSCTYVFYKPKYKGRYIGETIALFWLSGDLHEMISGIKPKKMITFMKKIGASYQPIRRIESSSTPEEVWRVEFWEFVQSLLEITNLVDRSGWYIAKGLDNLGISIDVCREIKSVPMDDPISNVVSGNIDVTKIRDNTVLINRSSGLWYAFHTDVLLQVIDMILIGDSLTPSNRILDCYESGACVK